MKKLITAANILDQRKKDHIELALQSRFNAAHADPRFYYEPILHGHPSGMPIPSFNIAGKAMKHPIWVSSMTGGTAMAATINRRLAKVCKEFGLGMGLGSCRIILDQNQYFKDFDIRKEIGDDVPLFANLGIAQMERTHAEGSWDKIIHMVHRLRADGLIIHVNPLQELFQPEGDFIAQPPIESIKAALKYLKMPVIVKEVGQGMGPQSLKALLQLPLEAIEFAAIGGTNFSILELKRNTTDAETQLNPLTRVGHSADEMVFMINQLGAGLASKQKCKKFIISGGIENFLDGYYLMKTLSFPSVYGQASAMLSPARHGYAELYQYVKSQIDGLAIAFNYLTIR